MKNFNVKSYYNKCNKKINNFYNVGKFFIVSNPLSYESYTCFNGYIFEVKIYNTLFIYNIITKQISDIIIENYYIREKQDLNKKLENKLPIKRDKIKCKKI